MTRRPSSITTWRQTGSTCCAKSVTVNDGKRPMFAPTSNFDHFWYALLALMGPRVLIYFYSQNGFDFSWAILCLWVWVGILYTLDWAIASYRKFRINKLY